MNAINLKLAAETLCLKEVKKCNYLVPSSTRKIRWEGLFISEPMVKGNSKLHNIFIFDLMAITDCMNCADCKKECYAVKAQVQYSATYNKRLINSYLARFELPLLEAMLRKQLASSKIKTVRVHSSGDFISQEYYNMWQRVALDYPKVKFYAYTKVEGLINMGVHAPNFNILFSHIHGKLNFGTLEYIQELKKDHGTFLCPVTTLQGDLQCGKHCTYCVTKKNVAFLIH